MSFNLIPFENDDLMSRLPSLSIINNTLLMIQTIKNLPTHSFNCLDHKDHPCSQLIQDNSLQLQISPEADFNQNIPSTKRKKTGCTCSKTNCLKRYCECFSSGKMCTQDCACYGCHNNHEHEHLITKANLEIKYKSSRKISKGCICKKSQCQKKYCECFNAGEACTDACKCIDCENNSHNPSCCSSSGEIKNGKQIQNADQDSKLKGEQNFSSQESVSWVQV